MYVLSGKMQIERYVNHADCLSGIRSNYGHLILFLLLPIDADCIHV